MQCNDAISSQRQNPLASPMAHSTPSSVVPTTVERPRIFAFPIGTLLAGSSNLTLKCVVEQREADEKGSNFNWYKNNRELQIGSNEQKRFIKVRIFGNNNLHWQYFIFPGNLFNTNKPYWGAEHHQCQDGRQRLVRLLLDSIAAHLGDH